MQNERQVRTEENHGKDKSEDQPGDQAGTSAADCSMAG